MSDWRIPSNWNVKDGQLFTQAEQPTDWIKEVAYWPWASSVYLVGHFRADQLEAIARHIREHCDERRADS